MIDPRTIDQDALAEHPCTVWQGQIRDITYRVVMMSPDEKFRHDVPYAVVEQMAEDAMNRPSWRQLRQESPEWREVMSQAIVTLGAMVHAVALAPMRVFAELEGGDSAFAEVIEGKIGVAGKVAGIRIVKGSMQIDRIELPEPISVIPGTVLMINRKTREVIAHGLRVPEEPLTESSAYDDGVEDGRTGSRNNSNLYTNPVARAVYQRGYEAGEAMR